MSAKNKQGCVSVGAIVSEIAKGEGKIVQVSVGNIREVVAIISDMVYEDAGKSLNGGHRGVFAALLRNGERRAKTKKRRAR